jgi:hypothetical protein
MNNFDRIYRIQSSCAAWWDRLSPQIAKVHDIRLFVLIAEIAGFPDHEDIRAWFDLYNGEGAYDEAVRVEKLYWKSTQGVKGED